MLVPSAFSVHLLSLERRSGYLSEKRYCCTQSALPPWATGAGESVARKLHKLPQSIGVDPLRLSSCDGRTRDDPFPGQSTNSLPPMDRGSEPRERHEEEWGGFTGFGMVSSP
jgi:hypothetical protein